MRSFSRRRRGFIETEAERRGRLAAEPGDEDFVFHSTADYIEAMAAQVRTSHVKVAALQKAASDDIKSPQTITKLAYGWTEKGEHKQTRFPRFSTMFGIASALGVEVVLRKRRKPT